jgi:hypothetical protein
MLLLAVMLLLFSTADSLVLNAWTHGCGTSD